MTPAEQAAIYKKADQARVDAMKAARPQQIKLWDHVNYPKACWELRLRQMRLYWDGGIQ